MIRLGPMIRLLSRTVYSLHFIVGGVACNHPTVCVPNRWKILIAYSTFFLLFLSIMDYHRLVRVFLYNRERSRAHSRYMHSLLLCQWLFLVPLIGGRYHIIP